MPEPRLIHHTRGIGEMKRPCGGGCRQHWTKDRSTYLFSDDTQANLSMQTSPGSTVHWSEELLISCHCKQLLECQLWSRGQAGHTGCYGLATAPPSTPYTVHTHRDKLSSRSAGNGEFGRQQRVCFSWDTVHRYHRVKNRVLTSKAFNPSFLFCTAV